jgi:hypothetical protein
MRGGYPTLVSCSSSVETKERATRVAGRKKNGGYNEEERDENAFGPA